MSLRRNNVIRIRDRFFFFFFFNEDVPKRKLLSTCGRRDKSSGAPNEKYIKVWAHFLIIITVLRLVYFCALRHNLYATVPNSLDSRDTVSCPFVSKRLQICADIKT